MKKVGRYFLLMAAIMTISSCVSTPPKKGQSEAQDDY